MPYELNYNTLSGAIKETLHVYIETIPDGQFHRFRTVDDDYSKKSGWYIDNVTGGAFGNWKTGEKHKFYNGMLSKSDRIAFKRNIKANKKSQEELRNKKYTESATIALQIWNECNDAMIIDIKYAINYSSHPYLEKKIINPYSAKIYGDYLIIPMYYQGHIASIQKIYKDGDKRFFYGGRVKGCFCPIGSLKDVLYICEGYATGCSIHEYTGQAVAVAFSAGNLVNVAMYLHTEFPDAEIIIAADNDQATELRTGVNPGIGHASYAASRIGSSYIYPEFSPGFEGTDFNDYLTQGGKL